MYNENMIKKFFDAIQRKLHLIGMHSTAKFLGKFGTKSKYAPLVLIEFDPTFTHNDQINLEKDIAWPKSHLDIN